MLTRLLTALPDGNLKFPLRYRRMVRSIMDRLGVVRNRFLATKPVITPGMEFLKFFTAKLDIAELDNYPNDLERYLNVIKFFKNDYLNSFDPAINGNIKGGRFVNQDLAPVTEIVLNSETADPLSTLPFDKPWSYWQTLRAVRIQYHDSLELLEDFTTCMLSFKKQQPKVVVMTLDVSILLFKYYKYVKDCQECKLQPNTYEFLRRYEYARFFDDLTDIWTLNLLNTIFRHPYAKTESIMTQLAVPKRIATENMLSQGIEGVREYIDYVKKNQVQPQDFLEIRWFSDSSIKDRMKGIKKYCVFPDRQQYLWCKALVWMPYLKFFTMLVNFFPEGADNQTIFNRCKEIYWRTFKYVKMPQLVRGEALRSFVEDLDKDIEVVLNEEQPLGRQGVED